MFMLIFILSLIGFIVCAYGLRVELQIAKNDSYKAFCDISDRASCTKTFKSPYGKLLGFSNIYMGFILYSILAICAYLEYAHAILTLTSAATIASLFFAYILFAKIKTICVICIAVYIINSLLLIAALYQLL